VAVRVSGPERPHTLGNLVADYAPRPAREGACGHAAEAGGGAIAAEMRAARRREDIIDPDQRRTQLVARSLRSAGHRPADQNVGGLGVGDQALVIPVRRSPRPFHARHAANSWTDRTTTTAVPTGAGAAVTVAAGAGGRFTWPRARRASNRRRARSLAPGGPHRSDRGPVLAAVAAPQTWAPATRFCVRPQAGGAAFGHPRAAARARPVRHCKLPSGTDPRNSWSGRRKKRGI